MPESKKPRVERMLREKQSETVEDIIKNSVVEVVENLKESFLKYIKGKEVEINSLKATLSERDKQISVLTEVEEKAQLLVKEIVKLKKEKMDLKSKLQNKVCQDCQNAKIEKESDAKIIDQLRSDYKENDERLRQHIFSRQEKVKKYIQILKERDSMIEELKEDLEKKNCLIEEQEDEIGNLKNEKGDVRYESQFKAKDVVETDKSKSKPEDEYHVDAEELLESSGEEDETKNDPKQNEKPSSGRGSNLLSLINSTMHAFSLKNEEPKIATIFKPSEKLMKDPVVMLSRTAVEDYAKSDMLPSKRPLKLKFTL